MTASLIQPALAAAPPSAARKTLLLLLIAAGFFALIAPVLSWPQFSGDSEDLVVEPVLEMHRGGPWWVPTLGGEPRMRKPPVATWASAAAVSSATVAQLRATDPAARDAAYRRLAFEVRWPALLAACLMLVTVGWTGGVVAGERAGIFAALICGSSFFFLRFCHATTTDVHLALWVSLTNLCLALAVLDRKYWIGFIGGGAALGLALTTKGPVALVETALPVIAFALLSKKGAQRLRRGTDLRGSTALQNPSRGGAAGLPFLIPAPSVITAPLTIGLVLMLGIGSAWYISAVFMYPAAAAVWWKEITRDTGKAGWHDPITTYLILLPYLLPWLVFFIAGCVAAVREFGSDRRMRLVLCLLIVPMAALTCFHDRKDRYLLPMLPPAAILAAYGLTRYSLQRALWALHWLTLGLLALGLPVAGALYLKTLAGPPWFSRPITYGSLALAAVLLGVGISLRRRSSMGAVIASALLMLLLNALFLYGWSQSGSGLSEMKPIADRIRAISPHTPVVFYDTSALGKPVTLDLDIYLDRPVPVVHTLAEIPPAALVVMLPEPADATPHLPGRQALFDMMSRKHHWYVMGKK